MGSFLCVPGEKTPHVCDLLSEQTQVGVYRGGIRHLFRCESLFGLFLFCIIPWKRNRSFKDEAQLDQRLFLDPSSIFQGIQQDIQSRLTISDFLIKPIQRITKYQLLLKVTETTFDLTSESSSLFLQL